jgi:UDP-N-acetylglucosamine transferase subunit ALG13
MNIFVSVGTQLPFERLVRAVDAWAGSNPQSTVFAQVGPSDIGVEHIETCQFLDVDECRRRTREADVVVSHAGMGSILTALEYGKPIVVLPRRASFGEHRNEHQLATVRHLGSRENIFVAQEADDIAGCIETAFAADAAHRVHSPADDLVVGGLVGSLRRFIVSHAPEPRRRRALPLIGGMGQVLQRSYRTD